MMESAMRLKLQDLARAYGIDPSAIRSIQISPEEYEERKQEETRRVTAQLLSEQVQGWIAEQVHRENRTDSFSKFRIDGSDARAKALEATKQISARDDGAVLTLLGGCGRGKTLLAVSAAREWMERNQAWINDLSVHPSDWNPFLCTSEANLLDEFDKTKAFASKTGRDQLMKKRASVGVLVIDEMGKRSMGADALYVIEEILDHRLGMERGLTMLVSNLSLQQFVGRYTDGLVSRISASGLGKIVTLGGIDYRTQGGIA